MLWFDVWRWWMVRFLLVLSKGAPPISCCCCCCCCCGGDAAFLLFGFLLLLTALLCCQAVVHTRLLAARLPQSTDWLQGARLPRVDEWCVVVVVLQILGALVCWLLYLPHGVAVIFVQEELLDDLVSFC